MSKSLSIEGAQDQFPPGLVPSDFALMHEYYTPFVVAEAVADLARPLLSELARYDGIGRIVRALGPPYDNNPSAPSATVSTNPAAKGLCHATYRHLRR